MIKMRKPKIGFLSVTCPTQREAKNETADSWINTKSIGKIKKELISNNLDLVSVDKVIAHFYELDEVEKRFNDENVDAVFIYISTWNWANQISQFIRNMNKPVIIYAIDDSKAWSIGGLAATRGGLDEIGIKNMVANIWKETPIAVLMILAALQTFPEELYEASSIDCANIFGKFKHITLPLLRPVLMVLLVIKTVWAIKEFDIIYMITRGGPAEGTTIITYFIYLQTFKFLNISYGAALGYVVTFIVMILAVIYVRKIASDSVT